MRFTLPTPGATPFAATAARMPRATRVGAALGLIIAATLFASPTATAREIAFQPSRIVSTQPLPLQDELAILQDATLPADLRSAACRRLYSSTDPAAQDALIKLLGPDKRTSDVQTLIVRELGAQPDVPPAFFAPLAALLKESTPDKHSALYRAISSIRTREAAALLLSYAGPTATVENRELICTSLARLSGRTDLGQDREAWARWIDAAKPLTEEQWRSQLTAALAQRADNLRAQRDDALRRVVESERARFLGATDAKTRSTILAGMLVDEMVGIRRLGIDLINRELANARELGPEVGTAALELLKDPAPEIRTAAADLIDRLLPAGAPLAIREALAREQSPNVLAKLLRLARRFPDVAPPEMLMGWLGADTAVRRAAIDAVAALQASGHLASSIDLERALKTLRSEKPQDLSVDGLKLLCELGDNSDRTSIAAMLTLPSADSRLGAAQALAPFPEWLDSIITAASNDATLFAVAASAISRHRANSAGYRALTALPAPTPNAMREAVNALCQRLPLADLRTAAESATDNEVREAMLARVVDLTAPSDANPAHDPFNGEDGPLLIDALLMLARTQIDLIKPAAALSTLDLLPPGVATHRDRGIRLKALLYLDRFEEAMETNATADEWLDAMEYAVSLPHSLAIAMEISLRFENALSTEQLSRLEKLRVEARRPRSARGNSSAAFR